MLQFFRDLKTMPYHIRKRILDRVYSVIMYSFLGLVLFPIVWMFYNSFMGNTEIVQGKLFFQRAAHNVVLIEDTGDSLITCTSDGSLTILHKDRKNITYRKRFNTSNTNWISDTKYIWLAAADKGLIRINRNNPRQSKRFVIDWKQQLDFNKISRTLIARDEVNNKIWLSLGYKDYDRIIELDSTTMKVNRYYNILDTMEMSFDKVAIANIYYANNQLFAATNRGLVKIDINTGTTTIINNPDFAINEIRNMQYDATSKELYGISVTRLYVIDAQHNSIKQLYTTITNDGFEQISQFRVAKTGFILGTGHGIILLNKAGQQEAMITDPLFDDVNLKGKLVGKGRYVISDVLALSFVNYTDNSLYLGSTSGRLALFNIKTKQMIHTLLIDKQGYYRVMWRNYIDLFHNIDFALYLRNSFIICGLTAFFAMVVATLTAYALVRFDFPGKQFMSTAVLSTQMIPGVLTLIPVYMMFMKITEMTGIPVKGTFWGIIFVYSAFFLPFSIWILRGFFASIPVALEEAATIDGCTPLQIFFKIALPLSIPGIVATGIYIFLNAWDELIFAWILTNANTMTIPVGIRLFVGNFQNRYDLLMAASTVATIPVMIMFMLLQNQIVSGLTSGAVKD